MAKSTQYEIVGRLAGYQVFEDRRYRRILLVLRTPVKARSNFHSEVFLEPFLNDLKM